MTKPELLAALKAAKGPSRELDESIWELLRCEGPCCYFTGTIDAALAFAERMLPWMKDHILRRFGSDSEPSWEFTIEHRYVLDRRYHRKICPGGSEASTAPLAICVAVVEALIS